MLRRLLTATICLLTVGAVLPQRSALPEAAAATPAFVAGVTTITGSKPSWTPVRLARPATIDLTRSLRRASGPNTSVSINGKGPFVGVVLTQDPPTDPVLIAGRFHECAGPACPEGRAPLNHMYPAPGDEIDGKKIGRSLTLPAGNYRLYLIAAEGQASVTLRLRGLSGKTKLSPKMAAPAMAYRPEVRKDINTGGAYYGAGNVFQGGGSGISVSTLFLRSDNFQGADYGACRYHGPTPPPEQMAFGVQCQALTAPGNGEGVAISEPGTGDKAEFHLTAMFSWDEATTPPSADGRYGAGLWYASRGAVQKKGSQTFYLSFDDDAPIPELDHSTTYKGGRRITDWHYEGPAVGVSGVGVCTHPIHACAIFPTNRSESLAHFEINDATGLPVSASVSQSVDGVLQNVGTFCGKTEEPLPITPGAEIVLFPWAAGRTNCPGAATTGVVTGTFF